MIFVNGVPLLVDIEQLLVDLKQALDDSGIHLLGRIKRSGTSVQFSCPFHGDGNERHPSCGILTTDKHNHDRVIPAGSFNCFTCGTSGTIDQFVSKVFGKNDAGIYGYKWLVSHYCSVEVEQRKEIDLGFETESVVNTEGIILEEELEKYRFYHSYMWERKLTKKVVDYFDVGYDKETDSITFPVKDLKGIVRYVQKRSVNNKFFQFKEDSNKGNYIYGLYEASLNPKLVKVVTEAPIDALTAWTRGYAGLATCGMISQEQINILDRFPTRQYIIATDADKAGNIAAKKLSVIKKVLLRMTFNGKKDLNEMTEEDWDKTTLKLML